MKLSIFIIGFLLTVITTQDDRLADAAKLYDAKQYQPAITICNTELAKLQEKDGYFIKFLSLRATCYVELNDFASGVKDYKQLIDLEPANITWYDGLAYAYGQSKDYNNCILTLKKELTLNPESAHAYNDMSYYSVQAQSYYDAIKYANDGLEFVADEDKFKGVLLSNKGCAYLGLKQYSTALKVLNESIEQSDDNAFAYCYRALANIGLKKMETVCADLQKSKSIGGVTLTDGLIKKYCKN